MKNIHFLTMLGIALLTFSAPAAAQAPQTTATDEITKDDVPKIMNAWFREVDKNARKTLDDLLEKVKNYTPANQLGLDLAVPDAPAFAVLNVNSETATRPTSPQTFVAQVLEGTDSRGNLQSGVALEITPYTLFSEGVSLKSFRDYYGVRLLSRTKISLATTKGTDNDEDKSVKAAVGISATLWDESDLRTNDIVRNCLGESQAIQNKAAARIFSSIRDDVGNRKLKTEDEVKQAIEQRFPAAVEAEYKRNQDEGTLADLLQVVPKCHAEAKKKLWNASGLEVGLAPIFFSKDGTFDGLDAEGFAVWTSLAYGFADFNPMADNSQLILHLRYHSDEKVLNPATGNNSFIEQDQFIAAAQLRIAPGKLNLFGRDGLEGGADWTLFTDIAYIEEDRTNLVDEELWRYSIGAEFAVDDGTHFKLSIGSEEGRDVGGNEGFILGRLKINFSAPDQKK